MTDFNAFGASTHPIVKLEDDWNNLLDHGLEKTATYIIRKNSGYYESIKGGTSSDAGTIVYGGADNAGETDGTDATAVIQAALSNSNGGTVLVKNGYYTITSLTLGQGDCLIGESSDITYGARLVSASDANIITLASYCVLKNFCINSTAAAFSHTVVAIETETDIKNCYCENLIIVRGPEVDIGGNGIRVHAGTGGTVTGCTYINIFIWSRFTNAVYVSQYNTGWTNSNHFFKIKINGNAKGIYVASGGSGTVAGNQFSFITYQSIDGVTTHGLHFVGAHRFTIMQSTIYDVPVANYCFVVDSDCKDITFRDCEFDTGLVSDEGTRTSYPGCVYVPSAGDQQRFENEGVTSIADGETIAHGLMNTPYSIQLTGTNSDYVFSVIAKDDTDITIDIKYFNHAAFNVDHFDSDPWITPAGSHTVYWYVKARP